VKWDSASGVIAAVLAALIFFWPFAGNKDSKNDKDNILLSAGDASRKAVSEKFSADKKTTGKDIYSENSSEAEKSAERTPEQNEVVKTQNTARQEVVKNETSKIVLKRAWRKKFAQPVTSSPVLCAQNIIFGCRDGFIYAFSDKGDFKWKYNLGEGVGSSPLCFKGEKVIGCDYQGNIVSLDPENGEILWKNSLENKIISSPAVIKGSLFVGTMAGDLYSVSLENGGIGWKKHLGSAIWSSIVTVENYIVVATVDGHLIKLDRKGKILWQIDPGGEIYSTPICLEKQNCVVIGTNNKLISAFSLSDGSLLWQYTVSGEVRGTPATDGKRIVIGTDDGKLYSFNMSGRILWMQVIGKAVRSKPLIYGKTIFITGYNTKLTAINIDSGNIIDTFSIESPIYSSPLYFNDRIFFGSNDGHFHSIDIAKKD
jgi:outer membrane protein assembly factor BamB